MTDDTDVLRDLCAHVKAAGPTGIKGDALARACNLSGTRQIRAILSRNRRGAGRYIVGLPGQGYFWGPYCREQVRIAAQLAREMGRDWFFLASCYGEASAQTNMAQLFLDFGATAAQRAALGLSEPKAADPLAAMAESGEISVGEILKAILDFMGKHKEVYHKELEQVRTHSCLVIDREAAQRLKAGLKTITDQMNDMLDN